MKSEKNDNLTSTLSTDSQSRLIAYTTAASLGAFFAGQNVEGQIVESSAFAPYPATILPPPDGGGVSVTNGVHGFSGFYHYFSIDGGATPEFFLSINNPLPNPPTARYENQFVDLFGQTTNVVPLTPTLSMSDPNGHTSNAYLVPFLGGTTINATTGSAPFYQPRLTLCYVVPNAYGGYYAYLDNKYIATGALGFEFVSSVDNQVHFGYMDVQVNTTVNSGGYFMVQSVVVEGVYYNKTPNAGITVPVAVAISSVNVAAGNAVTINFTSNDGAPASNFTLQTSPALGASAHWTTDPAATITLITPAKASFGINHGSYQAVTTGNGGPAQFYRIINSASVAEIKKKD